MKRKSWKGIKVLLSITFLLVMLFPVTAKAATINKLFIQHFVGAALGEKPITKDVITVDSSIWSYPSAEAKATDLKWYKNDTLFTGTEFEPGTYYAEITVAAEPGNEFADSVELEWYQLSEKYNDSPAAVKSKTEVVITTKKMVIKSSATATFVMNGHGKEIKPITAYLALENGHYWAHISKPEDPTDEEWEFINWYWNEDCTGDYVRFIGSTGHDEVINCDTTFYAKWVNASIKKIELGGFTHPVVGAKQIQDKDITIPAGANYTVSYLNWFQGGNLLNDDAVFEAGKNYAVKIPVTPASGLGFPKDTKKIDIKLDGSSDLIESVSSMGDSMTIITKDFYPDCVVSFDANGGAGTMEAVKVATEDGTYKYKLPACKFTAPEGKVFDKWDLGAEGAEVTIKDNTTVKALWLDKAAAETAEAEKSIEGLPAEDKITTDDAAAIEAAAAKYEALTPEQKAALPEETVKKLEAAKQKLAEIKKAEQKDTNSELNVEKTITAYKKETDPKGSAFHLLQAKVKSGKTYLTISWKKMKNAEKYVVYGVNCGKKNKLKKLKTLKASKSSYKITKIAKKALKKDTYYKFMVTAVGKENGYNKVLSKSKIVHAALSGGKKYTNPKAVAKVPANKTLKVGKTYKINAKYTKVSGKLKVNEHVKLRYESGKPSVATVDKNGKVKAKKKGKAVIYVYAQNGACASMKVTVKK